MIFKVSRFVDDDGKNINVFEQVDAGNEEPIIKIQGVVHLETPMGMIPIEFPFDESIKKPSEAFSVFEETAKNYINKMKEEAPRIITPGMQ